MPTHPASSARPAKVELADSPCLVTRDPSKGDALGALMQRLLAALDERGALPPLSGAQPCHPVLAPQAREWALFYLAQHCDKLGRTGAVL